MNSIRTLPRSDYAQAAELINAAAEAYRGVIPDDCWREPYMPLAELEQEIAAGVDFSGLYDADELVGLMGIQPVDDVTLIRHAYVLPARQGQGVGTELIAHLLERVDGRILVGTWAAAEWAIRFYERNGFELVPSDVKDDLLRTYWTIPERQVETSVVLARGARA